MTPAIAPYDAVLLCSFGGPNRAEDVLPFLRNVVAGKGVPEERLEEVGEHYFAVGGQSPINAQNLALRQALAEGFACRGVELPVLWSNRNWHPYTVDTLRDAHAFGARRILVIITSAYASYSGSRQYREHLAASLGELGAAGDELHLDVLRPFFNEPGFVAANTAAIAEAGDRLRGGLHGAHIVYVTHSIPTTMQHASEATGPGYRQQHEDVRSVIDAELAAAGHSGLSSSLAYCSRSGDPRTPWLEPDINEHLAVLKGEGLGRVVISPIGFISDHMEVRWDLETEAMATAEELGLEAVTAETAGTHPRFVAGLLDMVLERAARERGEQPPVHLIGWLPAFPDVAPPGSCRRRHGEVTGLPVVAGSID